MIEIELELIHLYNAVSQLSKAARYNRGRLLLSPYKEDSIMVATGSPETFVGVWFVKAEYESFSPIFVDSGDLFAFLSASHSGSRLKISIGKQVVFSCGRAKLTRPFEDGSSLKIFQPEMFVTSLSHKYFKDLARVANMAADAGDHRVLFTGAYLIIDEKFVRLVATDSFAAGYSWYERIRDEKSDNLDVLIPASSLRAAIGMSWEDSISIHQDSSGKIFFVSDRFYVYCTPLVNKEQYPVQKIMSALGGDLHSTIHCDPSSLSDKLIACSRIKAKDTPRIHFNTNVEDSTLTISSREQGSEMVFDINLLKHSGVDLSFIVDGRFVGKAISLLNQVEEISKVELSLSDAVSWIFITAPNLSARYTMATINPEAVD